MPLSPKRICNRCGMAYQGRCQCRPAAKAAEQRGTSAQRGYGFKWQQAREGWLRNHPLCVECEKDGRIEPAVVVDHIDPHRGDMVKFWDAGNWQSLCVRCHNRKTRMGK